MIKKIAIFMAAASLLCAGYAYNRNVEPEIHIEHEFNIPKYEIVKHEVCYELMVEATAYWNMDPVEASGHGIAYDGTPAVPYKTIAVDPKVIPLQSMVYVPGFGWMRANDTGNAIKGNIIDITMDSREAAFKWGRRKVLVKVKPPNPVKLYRFREVRK